MMAHGAQGEFPLQSRGFISGNEQRPVKCLAATAGVDAFGSLGDGAQGFGAGIAKDVERRLPHYPSDFTDGLHPKALSAVTYMILASLAPCFAFGGSVTLLCYGFVSPYDNNRFRSPSHALYILFFRLFFRILAMHSFACCDVMPCSCVTVQNDFARYSIPDGTSRDHHKLCR
jgi:hypothetical protein